MDLRNELISMGISEANLEGALEFLETAAIIFGDTPENLLRHFKKSQEEEIKCYLTLTLGQSGDFPGAPDKDTVEISEDQYDELWAKFIRPKAVREGWVR